MGGRDPVFWIQRSILHRRWFRLFFYSKISFLWRKDEIWTWDSKKWGKKRNILIKDANKFNMYVLLSLNWHFQQSESIIVRDFASHAISGVINKKHSSELLKCIACSSKLYYKTVEALFRSPMKGVWMEHLVILEHL